MAKTNAKKLKRMRRKLHIRKHVWGTAERPRLTVFRSNKHIYAQLIDDDAGHTLAAASSTDPTFRSREIPGTNVEAARIVGTSLGEAARAAGIEAVVFDRNGYLYHGRVRALADGARKAGLRF